MKNIGRESIVDTRIAPLSPERIEIVEEEDARTGLQHEFRGKLVPGPIGVPLGWRWQSAAGQRDDSRHGNEGSQRDKGTTDHPLDLMAARHHQALFRCFVTHRRRASSPASVGELMNGSFYAPPIVGVPIGHRKRIDTDADGVADTDNPNFMKVPDVPVGTPREGPTGWLKTVELRHAQDYRGMAAAAPGHRERR